MRGASRRPETAQGGETPLISYACYTDRGGRPCNEDTVEICRQDSQRLCAVLADGLGGHGGGKAASSAAVQTILQGWQGKTSLGELRQLAGRANRQVLSLQTKSCRMKTTVVVLIVEGARWQWAYAGDSRLYHFVEGNLLWQTKDHSSSQIAVLLGQIAPEQIRFHEDRSRIYRALGQDEATQVDAGEEAFSPGKHQFLLCSDGFWEYILEGEMEGQLKASATPQEWLDRMCSLLRERVPDNNDNNSAAAVWVEC